MYENLIVKVKSIPLANNKISVPNLDELGKIASILKKPILHIDDAEIIPNTECATTKDKLCTNEVYAVIDNSIFYIHIKGDKESNAQLKISTETKQTVPA